MKIITSILFIRNVFVSIANSEAESEDNKSSLLIKILQFAALLLLLFLSAVFTGLNLGLLSLDKTRMQILSDLGTETDKKRIKKIMRVRKHGNALLCTLLLSDLMCNVLISLIMDDLTNPIIAFFVTTFVTVIIGEILPEAICFRYGLAVGAALWWIVFFFMIVLSPIVFPLGWILDKIIGEEMGNTYDRKQLKKLIEIHTKEEITQLYGESGINKTDFILLNDAFDFRHKVAEQVMTKMEDVFLLDTTDILNQSLIERIVLNGLSRIPVCEPLAPDYSKYNSNNILGYIDTKDVLLLYINQQLKQEQNIDNDKEINNKKKSDNKNIKTSKSSFQFTFHNKPSKLTIGSIFNQFGHEKVQVTGDTTLPRVLKQMKRNKSHLAIVYINDNSNIEKDPIQQNQGILTREDIAQIFIGEEESRDGEEQDVDEDEEDQKEEVKKRNKIIDELNVIDENGGFGDQKEQSNDNDFKYQFEILDQSKDMEEDNEISGSQIQLNQVINEQTEIELNEQLSISDNKLEQNSNHKNKNKKIYQMEEEGELEHLNTTSDQTEQADILSDQLENDSELLIKSHKTESTNDEKQQHTDHQIKIKVSQSNQSQSSSTQSHSIFLKISKKNLQARRLWQMISPQSDFSDNDSTIIADILMHGLWLFKQRPQSFFGDTSNDLELDVMKLKGLNNEQQMNLKNEQKLSIAGSCGWTIEHMKQLISMSSIFVVPAQDKQQQSKQSTKSGIQLISEDQYPLKSMICQQGTFRPEIILVLEGQVEIYQKDFNTRKIKIIKLNNISDTNLQLSDIEENEINEINQINVQQDRNNLSYNCEGTIINQSQYSTPKIKKIAQLIQNHAQQEIEEILWRKNNYRQIQKKIRQLNKQRSQSKSKLQQSEQYQTVQDLNLTLINQSSFGTDLQSPNEPQSLKQPIMHSLQQNDFTYFSPYSTTPSSQFSQQSSIQSTSQQNNPQQSPYSPTSTSSSNQFSFSNQQYSSSNQIPSFSQLQSSYNSNSNSNLQSISTLSMIPPPPFIQQGIKNQVLFASPHSISIRAYEDHKDEQSNIDDEDNDDDQNILNTQSNTFAKRTMKLCIDLLYPLSCPYTIVASGQQSASVLLIKKQDFYKVINQL